jgi:hypothetical protein
MSKALLKELRFKIGEEYDLNEFNLNSLDSTFSKGLELENYEYIKDDFKSLFGIPFSKNIVLQYNGDILFSVIFSFNQIYYDKLKSEINKYSSDEFRVELFIEDKSNCKIVVR